MARLIPNPIGDITDKVDRTLVDVDVVLGRVDTTLTDKDGRPMQLKAKEAELVAPPGQPQALNVGKLWGDVSLETDTGLKIAAAEASYNNDSGMLTIPGAMDSGAGDVLFWGALSVALVIAGVVAFPVNRWLITRGRGHAVLHRTGVHGGPPTRVVAAVAVVAALFGTVVLVAEAIG